MAKEPTRDEVLAIIDDARAKKKNKKTHVRGEVEKSYPNLVGKQIKRGGAMYDAIDYLIDDVDSYG